jgi:hypothetical protein
LSVFLLRHSSGNLRLTTARSTPLRAATRHR